MELKSNKYNIGEFDIDHIKNNNLSIKITDHNTTVSGKIINSSNELSKNLEVVLYHFDSSHILVEVDRTEIDSLGHYKFEDVLIGSYVLKDTSFNPDNINANQILASADRRNIVPWKSEYNVANGYLRNGSRLNDTKDKVILLGGPNNGSASIYVYAIKNGIYDVEIQYIGGLRSFKLDINNKNTGEVYTTSNEYFGKILITVNLNLGYNLLKFYGGNSSFAPTLGIFTVNIVEQGQTTYNLTNGTLENGAKVNRTKDFVTNLGGPSNGRAKIITRVAQTGYYLLTINYRFGGRPFLVDINDISTGEVYTVQISYSGKFSFQVFFTRTFNELKFYGIDSKYAPNLGEFELTYIDVPIITEPDPIPIPVEPTPIPPKVKYNVDQGTLSNGAVAERGYVLYLGGYNEGRSKVIVNVQSTGRYNITIKYLYGGRPFKMDVNQKSTGQVYRTDLGSSGEFSTFIELNNGQNTIDFYGVYTEHASFLGEFTLDFLLTPPPEPPTLPAVLPPDPPPPEPEGYSVTKGVLENGARISSDKKFVVFLGGQFNGSSTVKVDVKETGKYNITVDFRRGNRPLKLDINGVSTGIIYRTPAINSGIFTTSIDLNLGENAIKFYGVTTEYSSNLGSFTLDFVSPPPPPPPPPQPEGYSVAKGVLESGAILSTDRKFVLYLGGRTNGSSTVEVDAQRAGKYNITVDFQNGNKPFKLDINGTYTGSIYITPNLREGTFSTDIELNQGNNTIKFYGTPTEYASNLGSFTLDFVSPPPPPPPQPEGYSVAKGVLRSGAILSRDRKFVLYLGGRTNGSSTVEVDVQRAGKYNITVDFQHGYRPLKLDINGVSTGTTYTTPTGHTGKFKTIIDLNRGINTIKFYGDRSQYASNLGDFTLDFVLTPLTPVLPPGTYNTANGILENGAILDVGSNFTSYLGGINDGSVRLTINVQSAGTYKVDIKYLAAESDRNLSVDVNRQNAGIYTPPETNGWSLADVKTFSFQILLNAGDNEIKFHGDTVNTAPRLGTFVVTQVIPPSPPPTLPDYTYRTLNTLSYDDLVNTLKSIRHYDIPGSFNFNADSYAFFNDANRVQAIINALEQSGHFFTRDDSMGIGTLVEVLRAGFYLAFYNNQLKNLDNITYRDKCLPAIRAIMDNSNFGFGTDTQDDVVENVASLIGNASADLGIINDFVPLLEEFKNNIVSYANEGDKRVALYKIISQTQYFLNREKTRNGYNVQSTAFYGRIDSFIAKVEELLGESHRILPDREDLTKNIIDGVGKLAEFRRDKRISQRALTNSLSSFPYLSGAYLEALSQIKNNFNSQLSDGTTINYDEKINEAKRVNLPNTYRFDDGKVIIKTGNTVSVNNVKKIYWASKEVKAQFVRVTGNDTPLDTGHADDILTMVIYNSPTHYKINYQLYGFSTDNGGIYQEEIGTFFTYDREVPRDSMYSLEELFRHEFSHYLFGRFLVKGLHGSGNFFIGNSSRLTWFNEGTAEFFAGATRTDGVKARRTMVQNLVNDRSGRLSLDILFSSKDGFGFYKYGFAFSYYMYTRNKGQFLEISRLIKMDDVTGYESYLQTLRADPTTNSSYGETIDYLIQNVGSFGTPSASDDYLSTHSYMTISQISNDITSIMYLTNIRTETKTSDYFETFTLRGTHDNGLSVDQVSDWNSINTKVDRALTELESKGWSGYKTVTAYFTEYTVDTRRQAKFTVAFHGILRTL